MKIILKCGRSSGCELWLLLPWRCAARAPSGKLDLASRVQLIKGLQEARGNGTSMISLIMPPKDQVLATAQGSNTFVRAAGQLQKWRSAVWLYPHVDVKIVTNVRSYVHWRVVDVLK